MNLRSCIRVLIAVAVVLAAASAARAGDKARARPFWGTYEGDVHWEYAAGTCPETGGYTTMSEAVGHTTQLGRTVLTERHCAEVDGLVTFTAANGDHVWGTYILGTNRELWSDETAFCLQASYTITGGTGRFENASGTLTMTVVVTPTGDPSDPTVRWPARFVWDGMIRY